MANKLVEFVTRLYTGDEFVAEVTVSPLKEDINVPCLFQQAIRVTSFSPHSERCLPIQVLHTIGSGGICFKMCASNQQPAADSQNLERLHSSCLNEAKTAVVSLEGGKEIHLVAMLPGSGQQVPCFWAYLMEAGLYASCLQMFNLRCLSIVFDLDETLIVANTQRSFEDRIEVLKASIESNAYKYFDQAKKTQMAAGLKGFQEDRAILKQFVESDSVCVNGRTIRATNEVVLPVVDGAPPLVRPIIRLQERNIVLTRINPAIRDTSVLVKFRPYWDELKTYIIAKGRKRFEVYICTMSERDYALEMWRLLDPDGQLINAKELNDRVTCVESGAKKSLEGVFARQTCHPKMAMVIDDRVKVWERRDQSRVHVVAPFAPYYAPQAEMIANGMPVLYVARNVACNVRGGFFRDFDEKLHQQMITVRYDTDLQSLPQPPDVSNYLSTEESQELMVPGFGTNVVPKEFPDGMANSEVEGRLKPQDTNGSHQPKVLVFENEDLRLTLRPPMPALQPAMQTLQLFAPGFLSDPAMLDPQKDAGQGYLQPGTSSGRPFGGGLPQLPEISKPSSPAREEGEVPESELDPDTRRRLLILQHGQDTGQAHGPLEKMDDPPFPILQVNIPGTSAGGWLVHEEEMSPRQPNRTQDPLILEPESPSFDRMTTLPFQLGGEGSFGGERDVRMARRCYPDEIFLGDERHRSEHMLLETTSSTGEEGLTGTFMPSVGSVATRTHTKDAVLVLQGIGEKCNQPVDYRIVTTSSEVSAEVYFSGKMIGEGVGRTRQEAKLKSAEHALRYLATNQFAPRSPGNVSAFSGNIYSGALNDGRLQRRSSRDLRMHVGLGSGPMENPIASTSGQANILDYRLLEDPVTTRVQYSAVTTLKDLCQMEGVTLAFTPIHNARRGFHCHVEVGGKLLGKGCGPSWEAAKQQAAEETLRNMQHHHSSHKRNNPPRSPVHSNKRPRAGEFLRGASPLRHIPGSPHRDVDFIQLQAHNRLLERHKKCMWDPMRLWTFMRAIPFPHHAPPLLYQLGPPPPYPDPPYPYLQPPCPSPLMFGFPLL